MSTARRLHRRHPGIKGQLSCAAGPFPAGSFYCANAIPALRWVYATLIETALVAYELVLPPLTPQQRERYYRESLLFAALFGIPKESLSPDWTAFSDYFLATVQSDTLSVSDRARTVARRLLTGADLSLPVPASYQDLTVALLPQPVRERFKFRYRAAEQRDINRRVALLRQLYPLLPARLRYVGPYQEAEQRLAGRLTPDFVTQMCNRFWIGRTQLPQDPVGDHPSRSDIQSRVSRSM